MNTYHIYHKNSPEEKYLISHETFGKAKSFFLSDNDIDFWDFTDLRGRKINFIPTSQELKKINSIKLFMILDDFILTDAFLNCKTVNVFFFNCAQRK